MENFPWKSDSKSDEKPQMNRLNIDVYSVHIKIGTIYISFIWKY